MDIFVFAINREKINWMRKRNRRGSTLNSTSGDSIFKNTLVMQDKTKLIAVKLIHTAVWAIFAGSIIAIPLCAFWGRLELAWGLIVFVFIEVIVLVANRMRCPLTDVAARYTDAREDNFDIYLPVWLARNNKVIFGGLYLGALLYVVFVQVLARAGA